MNTFVLEPVEEFVYERVKYYSVRFMDHEASEFHRFIMKMEGNREYSADLDALLEWLEGIGEA